MYIYYYQSIAACYWVQKQISCSCHSAFRHLLQTEMRGPWTAWAIEGNQLVMSSLLKKTECKPHVTAKLPENCKTVRKKHNPQEENLTLMNILVFTHLHSFYFHSFPPISTSYIFFSFLKFPVQESELSTKVYKIYS